MSVTINKQILSDMMSVQEAEENKIVTPSDEDISKYGGLQETASQMISQISDSFGEKGLQSALSKLLGYTQTVPTIQEFIDDDKWLGNQIGEKLLPEQGLFPCWRAAMYEIYPNPFYSPVIECVGTGAIGIGKTTWAVAGAIYDLIRLCMLENPHKKFGLLNTTKISYAIINATLNLAGDIVYDKLYQMVITSPGIREFLNKSKARGHTLFNKNINVFIGSRASHALGEAIVGAILDEINFQQKVLDQAYNNYKSVKRRIESRFMDNTGSYPARVWMLSSKNREVDFLDTHISKVRGKKNKRGEETVKICDLPIWAAKGHHLELSGKTFKVFIGDDHRDAKILERPTDIIGLDESRILDVPIEFGETFRYDIHNALREVAGISISSIFKLIPSIEVINKGLRLNNPVFREEIQLDLYDKSDVLMDYMDLDNLLTPQYRYCPRYIHIDMGLKHDRLGMASSFVADTIKIKRKDPFTLLDTTIMEPLFMTEFTVAIRAKASSEIPIYKVKNFLYQLRGKGYPIAKITMDGFQSDNLRQDLLLMGFNADNLSVDRYKDPYLCLKNAYLQGRILSAYSAILKSELRGLVDVGKKIDHPPEGSKDVSDSQAGSVFSAYQDYLRYPALKSMAEKSRKHIVGEG